MNRFRSLTVVAVLSSVGFANGDGVALDDPRGVFGGASNGGGAYVAAPELELVACGSECLHDSDDFLDFNLMVIPPMASLRREDVSCYGFSALSNGLFRLVLGGETSAWGEVWVGSPPLRWGELYAAASVHRCSGGVQEFCYACGRRHAIGGEYACSHSVDCAAKSDYTNACTCAPLFVRVNWDDDNWNLREDRLDQVVAEDDDEVVCYRSAGETRECCCGLIPQSCSVTGVTATAGLRLRMGGGAGSFGIEAIAASYGVGTESVSYEVRDETNGVIRTITRAVTAANLEIRPDFDDDGEIDAEDRFGWWHDDTWQVRVRDEPYVMELVSECPTCADVSLVGSCVSGVELSVRAQGSGAAVLPLGETVRSPSFAPKNETRMLEVDTSGGPGVLDLTYTMDVGGTRLSSTRRIHAVDTSVGEQWTTPSAVDDVVYDYSEVLGDVYWAVYRCEDDEWIDGGAGGVFSPGELPPGNYRVEVYFSGLFEDGSWGYLSVGWLHVVDVRLERLYETSNPVNRIFNPTRKDDTSGNFVGEKEHAGTSNEERYAAPRNYLYVVGAPDTGNFNVSARFNAIGAEGCTNYYCAFYDGETKIPGSETNVDFTADAVEFSIPAMNTDAVDVLYQLRGGLDLNGNHSLDSDEASSFTVYTNSERRLKKAYVKGITLSGFAEHLGDLENKVYCYSQSLSDNPPSFVAPAARSLLALFYGNGNQEMLDSQWVPTIVTNMHFDAFSTNCSCFAEWLTHNSGAEFDSSGVTDIVQYVWCRNSRMSRYLAGGNPFVLKSSSVLPYVLPPGLIPGGIVGDVGIRIESATPTGVWLKDFYDVNVRSLAEEFLRDAPVGTETNMPSSAEWYRPGNMATNYPYASLSPPWVPGATIVVGTDDGYGGWGALLSQVVSENGAFDDYDAFGAIGRGRLIDPRYRFRIRKCSHLMSDDTCDVVEVVFACTLTDLYDFNYEDGDLPACAAAVQIGFGAGSTPGRAGHGKIFSHKIEIEFTYPDPFECHTTIEWE